MDNRKLDQDQVNQSAHNIVNPPQDSNMSVFDVRKNPSPIRMDNPAAKPSKMYFLEYFMKHLLLWVLVCILSYTFTMAVTSLYSNFEFSDVINFGAAVSIVTGLIILLPIVLLLISRTRKAEVISPGLKQRKVRKWMLNIFIFIYAISALIALGTVVAIIVTQLFKIGAGANFGQNFFSGLSAALVSMVAFASAGAMIYRENTRDIHSKFVMPFLVGVTILALLLTIIFPVRLLRGADYDRSLLNDVTKIQNGIDSYYRSESKMPSSLNDITTSNLENDISKYDYDVISQFRGVYELCAEFKTDESDKSIYSSSDTLRNHEKGRDCAEFEVRSFSYSGGFDSPSPVPEPLDILTN